MRRDGGRRGRNGEEEGEAAGGGAQGTVSLSALFETVSVYPRETLFRTGNQLLNRSLRSGNREYNTTKNWSTSAHQII